MLGLVQGISLRVAWFCFGFPIALLRFGQVIGVRILHPAMGRPTNGAGSLSSPDSAIHPIDGRPPCGSAPGGATPSRKVAPRARGSVPLATVRR
jgi:hypothetical protein